jgi:hypothetical protein
VTELQRRYRQAYYAVWGNITALTQIVTEDYPDPETQDAAMPTRYQVDELLGLAGSLSALVEGHERK